MSENAVKNQNDKNETVIIRELNRKLTLLWCYLQSEDMWEDAEEYLEDHEDDEFPFEANWMN